MTDAPEREDVRPDPRTPAPRTPVHPDPAAGPARRTAGPRAALAAAAPTRPSGWVALCALPVATALWLAALPGVRLSRMGDLGLLQALPPLWYAVPVLLTVGFVAVLRAPVVRHRWAGAYVLALILMIHATPSLLYPTLRYAWAWKHVAIIDTMLRHGGAVPGAGKLDVYNQWPGFFEFHALVLRATGLDSVLGYASWYPVITNVLLLGPLLLLYRSFTTDRRLIWGGIWLYYATAWVGQDYFSPQALAYLLHLTVIALVVNRLAARRRLAGAAAAGPAGPAGAAGPASADGPAGSAGAPGPAGPVGARALGSVLDVSSRAGWRAAPFALLLVLIAAIVSSHQLTPVMLAASLLLLALGRRNRRTVLPVLAAVVGLTVLWDATVARPFVSANLSGLISALGSPDHNAVAGLARLGEAPFGQILASWADRGLTAAVLLLALAGALRHRWVRRVGLLPLLAAPVLVLLANAYDGEMLFRAYLFALPAAAFLAAALLWGHRAATRAEDALPPGTPPRPVGGPGGPLRTGVCAVLLLGLLTGTLFGYYSKEAMNYFTPQEVAAVRYVAETPAGSRIISLTANEPGGELNYDTHDRLVLGDAAGEDLRHLAADPGDALRGALSAPNPAGGPTYLILTRGQVLDCELTGLLPASAVQGLAAAAAAEPTLRRVYANQDAVVYQYTDSDAGGGAVAPAGGSTP
ncbi:glycosyltransferase [Kitasatospora purpeofusca]|uniref:glycosyltransferase n=1 Tax=Kitasatospora purpeofusca TaxID=67352 RepID=UPI00369F6FDE